MIEVIQAPEIEVGTSCLHDAIRVTYVLDGVTTVVDVPKVGVYTGKNYYQLQENNINITFFSEQWELFLDGIGSATYTCVSDAEIPSSLTWVYQSGTELDSITTESVQAEFGCLLVNYNSEQYQFIENGDNHYFYNNEDFYFTVELVEEVWTFSGFLIPTATTPDPTPYSTNWDLEGLTTEECECGSFTSKWQAVHHPIKWQVQRKDRLVEDKSIDGGGYVSLLLTELPPTELQVGNLATYYLPNGDKIGSLPVTAISGYRIRLLSLIPGVVEGGFVIFDDLYSNYYIETSILENGTDEISTARTIPNSDGSAVIDVHRFLKTKALFQNTDTEDGMSGKYKLKFRECYNFTKQLYGELTDFYYWSNSAKQIRDLYGSNMAEYVGNLAIPCKFLSVFERPTNFIGYPFSLSYITSGDWTKFLRRVENSSTHTLITHQNGAVNRLSITDTATSVMIEYGTLTLLPPTFTYEGDLTETKQIKINTKCLQNAVCLTWLNTLGGHEYWVFSYNQIYSVDTAIGSTFEPYIQDLENGRSNIFDLERFETNKITLGATVDIEDIKGLKTILSSISVEMLTAQGWISVRPEVGSFKVYESKGTTADIELTIQLPYTNIQSR